jgi:Nucleotidyl transferase AbiEii toxin, Type IV TA system
LRFEVEISGRHEIPANWRRRETVAPPASYGMAPFMVETYSNDVLAAMKIAAAMSEARNAPRDIYDLHDLIAAQANPVPMLALRSSPDALKVIKANALSKLDLIRFELAREELLPYLPTDVREHLTEVQWLEYTLIVGTAIERWCDEAIAVLRDENKS